MRGVNPEAVAYYRLDGPVQVRHPTLASSFMSAVVSLGAIILLLSFTLASRAAEKFAPLLALDHR